MAPATGPLRDGFGGKAGTTGAELAPALGVYVHFPWCLAKCPYCDFLSVAAPRSEIPHEKYADSVLAELDRRATDPDLGAHRLTSVFFGGGTPSLWKPSELARVLQAITAALGRDHLEEVTVECNPSSFDGRVATALLDAGVNRVSIGVQGLDDARLRFLGRLHDASAGLSAVEAALRAGVPRVSADFIFGVSGQSSEDAVAEATRLAETGVTHLSAYALTIEPGTQFGALARKGRLPLLHDDVVADSFVALDERLRTHGFEHYEISNYARDGHRSRHNVGYWTGDDYLGLGCGAWGTVRRAGMRLRYRNTRLPDRYVEARRGWATTDLARGGPDLLVSEVEVLSPEVAMRERLLLGLRLADGVDVDRAAHELGVPAWTDARARAADRLIERGRLRRDGSRLFIPNDAWLLADGTIADLL